MSPLPEYCIEGTQVLNRNHPHLLDGTEKDDIYTIDILRPITVNKSKSGVSVRYEQVNGWKRDDLSEFKSFIHFIREHLAQEWAQNVKQHENRNSEARICANCKLEKLVCLCKSCDSGLKPESQYDLSKYYDKFHEGLTSIPLRVQNRYDQFDNMGQICMDIFLRKVSLLSFYRLLATSLYFYATWLVQNWKLVFGMVIYYIISSYQSYLLYIIPLCLYLVMLYKSELGLKMQYLWCIALLVIGYFYPMMGALSVSLTLPGAYYLFMRKKLRQQTEITYRNSAQAIREHYYSRMTFYSILGASGSLITFLIGLKVCASVFSSTTESKRDVASEPYLPEFKPSNSTDRTKYFYVAKPSEAAQTTSRERAIDFIGRKMLVVKIITPNSTQMVRGIPCGSEIMLPAHAVPNVGRFTVEICADNTKRTSSYKDTDVGQDSYRILKDRSGNDVDAVLLHMSNMPVQPDLRKYFTSGQQPEGGPGQELFKEENGTFRLIDLRLSTPKMWDFTHYDDQYRGRQSGYAAIKCEAQEPSFDGMCGSPIISEDSNCILGFHVAGSGTNMWFGLRITSDMIEEARNRLIAESKCFIAHPVPPQFCVERTSDLGFEFDFECPSFAIDAIGEKSSPIEEIGVVYRNGVLYADRAEKHYFKNTNPGLEESFGPRNAQPPVYPNGEEQINSTLKKLHKPKFDVPVDLIDRAVSDYLDNAAPDGNSFNKIIRDLRNAESDFFRVRDLEQALQGIIPALLEELIINPLQAGFTARRNTTIIIWM
jgi:hypothetical protein